MARFSTTRVELPGVERSEREIFVVVDRDPPPAVNERETATCTWRAVLPGVEQHIQRSGIEDIRQGSQGRRVTALDSANRTDHS